MADQELEAALRDLEVTANSFAVRLIRMAEVRCTYVEQVRDMSRSIRECVEARSLSPQRGAELANQLRNQIMEMQRARDFDLGRSLAQRMKPRGLTLEESIANGMKKLGVQGRPFPQLSGPQQRDVLMQVIDSAGHSQDRVTRGIPRMRWAARGLWLATFAIAAYNIGTSENPWWQAGRETANIAGGLAGGFAGGAAIGAIGGVWAGPIGIAVGMLVGGVLGALLADHAYVETAGTGNPMTRSFVGRFTGFWSGVDEAGMARALATEYRGNLPFARLVFLSLDDDYHADADDVALEYVTRARHDLALEQGLRGDPILLDLLIRLLDEGWTSSEEARAIEYLRWLRDLPYSMNSAQVLSVA